MCPGSDDRDSGSHLTRAVAEEVAPEVGRFIGTIAGSPSFEIGELVAGHFRFRRFKQGVRQIQRAQRLLADAGLEPRQVPMRTLVPLVEGGSSDDDGAMCERWAALLANAAGGRVTIPPSFPQVLSQLEPLQAQMLDQIFDVAILMDARDHPRANVPHDVFRIDEYEYHQECLTRLGLIEWESSHCGFPSCLGMLPHRRSSPEPQREHKCTPTPFEWIRLGWGGGPRALLRRPR